MRIYLDDILDPPIRDRYTEELLTWDEVVRTAGRLIALVDSGQVTFIDFDNDLGGDRDAFHDGPLHCIHVQCVNDLRATELRRDVRVVVAIPAVGRRALHP